MSVYELGHRLIIRMHIGNTTVYCFHCEKGAKKGLKMIVLTLVSIYKVIPLKSPINSLSALRKGTPPETHTKITCTYQYV